MDYPQDMVCSWIRHFVVTSLGNHNLFPQIVNLLFNSEPDILRSIPTWILNCSHRGLWYRWLGCGKFDINWGRWQE